MVAKSLILCEGGDDVGFLTKFCKYLELDMKKVVIQKMSSKSNFFKESSYTTIKQKVRTGLYDKVLFIVDADYLENDVKYGGFANSKSELEEIISVLGFGERAKYYIMCNPTHKNGNLEHLVLSTIDGTQRECIEVLLDCVVDMKTHSDKKIVLSSYEAIFKEAPYNLTHNNFNTLKNLLLWIGNSN